MPIEVLMPALSPTMTEGNLAKWHKKEGDAVKAGDILAEIETDKATMEFEAADEGTLGRILVPEGTQAVKVNQPIAVILGEGEDAAALDKAKPAPAKPAAAAAPAPETQKAEPAAAANKPAPAPVAPKTAPPPPRAAAPPPAAAAAPRSNGHADGERVFASPLAKRMAEQAGLDLARLTGSGPHGRIVKHDIETALAKGPAALKAPAARAPAAPGAPLSLPSYGKDQVLALAGNPPYEEVPLTAMRRIIAKRMQEAKATIPHFYLTVDCEIDSLLRMRKEINDNADLKVSVSRAEGRRHHRRGDEGPRRARARRQAQAHGVPGRPLLDLQSRHVRHQGFRRGDQPAAWRDPRRRRRRAASGGEERPGRDRDDHELHHRLRPSRRRRRRRRAMAASLQEDHRSAGAAGALVLMICGLTSHPTHNPFDRSAIEPSRGRPQSGRPGCARKGRGGAPSALLSPSPLAGEGGAHAKHGRMRGCKRLRRQKWPIIPSM